MIRSMTGYGQGTAEAGGVSVSVDVRSVNHRFVDLRIRIPGLTADRERVVRRMALDRVRRGRVEITASIERSGSEDSEYRLNTALVAAATSGAGTVYKEYGISGKLDLATLFSLPGMLLEGRGDDGTPSEDEFGLIDRAVGSALAAHDVDRCREGGELANEMAVRLANMKALVQDVSARAAGVPARAREKLVERLEALTQGLDLDPARLAQEAAVLADRSDVTEELVRLESHVAQAASLLADPDGEPVGKRLDFLVQEIHRETNTINSKSSDLEVSRIAMAMKGETEKIREQVQNVE